jgi:hypothetical protein
MLSSYLRIFFDLPKPITYLPTYLLFLTYLNMLSTYLYKYFVSTNHILTQSLYDISTLYMVCAL